MKRKFKLLMVINSTNINKMNNHFSSLKRVPSNTDNSLDILKNQLKRQGQQNKISNNKKRKLSTKITPYLEEGNRQTELLTCFLFSVAL
jgi:hypothetical protein